MHPSGLSLTHVGRSAVSLATLAFALFLGNTSEATTFTRVAGTNTAVPNGTGTFTKVKRAMISGTNVIFYGESADRKGLYRWHAGALTRLADTTMLVPNTTNTVSSILDYDTTLTDTGDVVFNSAAHNILKSSGGVLSSLVDTNFNIPGRSEKFVALRSAWQNGGLTTFVGYGTNYYRGIYALDGTNVSVIINPANGTLPGTDGLFAGCDYGILNNGQVAFVAGRSTGGSGVYCYSSNQVYLVADTNTIVPGRAVKFTGFTEPPTFKDGKVVFSGGYSGGAGLFSANADGSNLTTLIDTDTSAPGSSGKFTYFYAGYEYSNNRLIFFSSYQWGTNYTDTTSGIYMVQEGVVTKIVDTSDTLDGQHATGFDVGIGALSPAGDIAFTATFGSYPSNFTAIYTTVAGGTPPPATNTTKFLLTTTVTPNASGFITKNPTSTNGYYASNSVVSVTANPNSGYAFVRWSGATNTTSRTISVTMNGNKSLTATFTNLPKYKLTTSISPAGAGTVSLYPYAVSNLYNSGSVVTLTANTNGANRFAAWMGAASGVTNVATITMNTNKAVTALFNNPGKFVFQNTNGQVAVWFMQNTQRVTTAVLNNGISPASNWRLAASADFNFNGSKDLLFRGTNGQAMVWLLSGNNVTNSTLLRGGYIMAPAWRLAAAADFNKDGKSDALWQNSSNNVLNIWLMNGLSYSTNVNLPYSVTTGWRVVAGANFDTNSSPDILFQSSTGTMAVWLMNGLTRVSTVTLNGGVSPGSGWIAAGATDVDGDGRTDIVFQRNDGALLVWFMNGTTFVRSAVLPSTIAPSWSLRAVK